jgi:DNA invertase Pin-like site-specific DNA recombinase
MHVLHRCDNRACVNPDHLFLGSHSENMRDMAEKGRAFKPLGISRRHALTMEMARKIRELFSSHGATIKSLADMYGLEQRTIRRLINNETWKDD